MQYVIIQYFWLTVDVFHGIVVDLPPMLTYFGSLLLEHSSSDLWLISLTCWVGKVSSFVLWDFYDRFRVC